MTTSTILSELRESGNEAAWNRFVERFRPPVIGFARRLGLSDLDAEDAAQETLSAFALAFREGRYERDRGRLSSWLFGIAWRQCQSQRRRVGRPDQPIPTGLEAKAFWAHVPDRDAAGDLWERHWNGHLLRACVEQVRTEVSDEAFRAYALVVHEERSTAEAATELGIEVKAVYNHKHRVLKRLRAVREELENTQEPPGDLP